MSSLFLALVLVIVAALVFDYINGFHDTANAIATVVSTGVLPIRTAILLAAVLNFVGALTGTAVAGTIGKGLIAPEAVSQVVVLSALIGAIFWNLFTWYFGIPSSSSHALVGGLAGAAMAKAGRGAVQAAGLSKIVKSLIISPLVGFAIAFVTMITIFWICRRARPAKVNVVFRRLQMVSAGFMALSHGSNDAQKTMGIIAVLLFSTGHLGATFHVPVWVIISCHAAIAAGTMFGGWRIVKTMGMKLTKLQPVGGFAAETAAASTLFLATFLGIPVSTTHTITGSIMGVGATRRLSAVRWGVVNRILAAWFFTIPASAAIAALFYLLIKVIASLTG